MAEDRTEKYGLTRSTSKPIKLACWDWSVAVKTLQAHHEREPAVLGTAVNDFNASVGDERNPPLDALRHHATQLAAIAENLRNGRAALVDELVGMWPAIQDVVDEEKDLRHRAASCSPRSLTRRPRRRHQSCARA
jgi:hypothetical protein